MSIPMIIKKPMKQILAGLGLKKYRYPYKEGFIEVNDKYSMGNIKLYWRPDSFMETEIFKFGLYGEWEKQSLEIWAQLSMISSQIVDIGANTGIYSIVAKKNNLKAQVVAIEPIQTNFEILSKNVVANALQITTVQAAVSNYEGTSKMFVLKDRLNYMTALNDNRYNRHPEHAKNIPVIETIVQVNTLENIAHNSGMDKIDLIKIDVEGHELVVFESIGDYLKINLPSVLVEIISDDAAQGINKIIENFGYYILAMNERDTKCKLVNEVWNNQHHNFLLCNEKHFLHLKKLNLIEIEN